MLKPLLGAACTLLLGLGPQHAQAVWDALAEHPSFCEELLLFVLSSAAKRNAEVSLSHSYKSCRGLCGSVDQYTAVMSLSFDRLTSTVPVCPCAGKTKFGSDQPLIGIMRCNHVWTGSTKYQCHSCLWWVYTGIMRKRGLMHDHYSHILLIALLAGCSAVYSLANSDCAFGAATCQGRCVPFPPAHSI